MRVWLYSNHEYARGRTWESDEQPQRHLWTRQSCLPPRRLTANDAPAVATKTALPPSTDGQGPHRRTGHRCSSDPCSCDAVCRASLRWSTSRWSFCSRRSIATTATTFAQYAPSSLRRRLKKRLEAEGLPTFSALQDRVLHDAYGDGAPPPRHVRQRDGDVPRPHLLPRVAPRRSCRSCGPIRPCGSGMRAAPPARRSTRWRSSSRRRGSTSAPASTRRT